MRSHLPGNTLNVLEAPCIIQCFLKFSFRETMLQLLGWNSAIRQNKILLVSDLKVCAYTL